MGVAENAPEGAMCIGSGGMVLGTCGFVQKQEALEPRMTQCIYATYIRCQLPRYPLCQCAWLFQISGELIRHPDFMGCHGWMVPLRFGQFIFHSGLLGVAPSNSVPLLLHPFSPLNSVPLQIDAPSSTARGHGRCTQ